MKEQPEIGGKERAPQMKEKCFDLAGRRVRLLCRDGAELLLLQPVDEHDARGLDRQWAAMAECPRPLALAAFSVEDWNRDLSPWEAPPVFGKVPFSGGAEATLAFVTGELLPRLREEFGRERELPLCLGGYSLAGLFALWAATKSELFQGIAAASPSVWFPGWLDYAREHPVKAQRVYLSLGDREERAKNAVMARVGDCIREQYALLRKDCSATLEWNEGGHFQDPEGRTARAFRWLAGEK